MSFKLKSRFRFLEFFLILFLGIGMTILVTWPLAKKTGIYYNDAQDYPLNGWILWYDQMAIKTGRIFHQKQYFDAPQMYPLPDTLCYSENMFVPSLFFSPIYWITHDLVLSVNCFTLLTFVLSFLSAYYCINYFVRDWRASLVGAAIYAFNPLTLSNFPSEIQLMNKYFLPLIFLFAYRYFMEPNWKDGFYFWLFFVLNGLSVIYFEVFAVVLLPFFLLPIFIHRVSKKDWLYFWRVVKEGWAGVFLLPVLFYFYFPYLQFSRKQGIIRHLNTLRRYSGRISQWFCPQRRNLLYGPLSGNILSSPPHRIPFGYSLFLNFLPMILFLFGFSFLFIGYKKNAVGTKKIFSWCYLFLLLSSFVLSFGPFFLGWKTDYGKLKLPFYYLYRLTPLLNGIRSPLRFQFVFYIPFALVAAFGARFIFNRIRVTKPGFLVAFFLFFILLENYSVRQYRVRSFMLQYLSTRKSRFQFLRHQVTLHYPTFISILHHYRVRTLFGFEPMYLNWDTVTGEVMMNGYSGFAPNDWLNFMAAAEKNLGKGIFKELKALGVNFVVIHKNFMPPKEFQLFYQRHRLLYKQGLVYRGKNTLVLSLKKYHFKIHLCDFQKDFVNEGLRLYAINGEPAYVVADLKNEDNCYLVSKFNSSYYPLTVWTGGLTYHTHLILPFIVLPYQKIQVYGYLRTFKLSTNPIGKFKVNLNSL
jgi:hypothetical protein